LIVGDAELPIATTNASGLFTVPDVFVGQKYTIRASYFGHTAYMGEIVVGTANVPYGDIVLYQTTFPPRGLTAAVAGTSVNVTWQAPFIPDPGSSRFTHCQTETIARGIGTNSANQFIKAHRFTQDQLHNMGVAGGKLAMVQFVAFQPANVSSAEIRIYTGGTGFPLNPGTMVYSQAVSAPFTPG